MKEGPSSSSATQEYQSLYSPERVGAKYTHINTHLLSVHLRLYVILTHSLKVKPKWLQNSYNGKFLKFHFSFPVSGKLSAVNDSETRKANT